MTIKEFRKMIPKNKAKIVLLYMLMPFAWVIDITLKAVSCLFARRKAVLSYTLAAAMLLTMLPTLTFTASASSTDTLDLTPNGIFEEESYTAVVGITTAQVGLPYETGLLTGPYEEVTLNGFLKLVINQATENITIKSGNKLTVEYNVDRNIYDLVETKSGDYWLYSFKTVDIRHIIKNGSEVTVKGNILAGCDNGVYYLAYDWNDNRELDYYEEKNYTSTSPIMSLIVEYQSHLTVINGEWNEIFVADSTDTVQEGGVIGTYTVTSNAKGTVRFTQNGGRADKLTTNWLDAGYTSVEHNGLHPVYFNLNAPAYNGLSPVGEATINSSYSGVILLGANFPNVYADNNNNPVILGGDGTTVDARLYSFDVSTKKIKFYYYHSYALVLLPDGFELKETEENLFEATTKTGSYIYNYIPIVPEPVPYRYEINREHVKNKTNIIYYDSKTTMSEDSPCNEYLYNYPNCIGPFYIRPGDPIDEDREPDIANSMNTYLDYLVTQYIDAGVYYAGHNNPKHFVTPSFFSLEIAPAEVTITVNKVITRKVGELNMWGSDYYTATLYDGTDVTDQISDKYLLTYLDTDEAGSGFDLSLTQQISADGNYHYNLINGEGMLNIQANTTTVPSSAVATIVSEIGAGEDGWCRNMVELRAPDGYLISTSINGPFTKSIVYNTSSTAVQNVSYYLKLNNGGNAISEKRTIHVKLCDTTNVATVSLNGAISGTGTSRTASLNIERKNYGSSTFGLWKMYAVAADTTPSYSDVIQDSNLVYTNNTNTAPISVTFDNLSAGKTYQIYYVMISSSGASTGVTALTGGTFATEKIVPTVTTAPSATATCGTKLKNIAITGGVVSGSDGKALTGSWAWTNSADYEMIPTVGGTTAYSATFTPDSTSYKTVTENIIPTVAYETPTSVTGVYQIKTVNDLMWLAALVNGNTALTGGVAQNASAKAVLIADIDMKNQAWSCITSFGGTLDGGGHIIKNLNSGTAEKAQSSFIRNLTAGGVVKNLCFDNAASWYHASGRSNAIIAETNNGTIQLCRVSNSQITCGNYGNLGGLAAVNNGTIEDCSVSGMTLTRMWSGVSRNSGCITEINNGVVKNCYSYNCKIVNGVTKGAIVATGNAPVNSFYSLSEQSALQNSTVDGTVKTAAQFTSGEVTYLLNGGKTDGTQVWYQTVGTDLPAFSGDTVYYGYVNCGATEKTYANTATTETIPDHTYGEWTDSGDGTHSRICSVCNKTETANHVDADTDYICDDCGADIEIISVNISWGSMEFTYVDASDGTWNPQTCDYENPAPAKWTCDTDADKITVTSESNVDLNASFSYKKTEGVAVTGSFTDGTKPVTAALPIAKKDETPQTVVVYLKLDGKPEETVNQYVMGTVTVTIGD